MALIPTPPLFPHAIFISNEDVKSPFVPLDPHTNNNLKHPQIFLSISSYSAENPTTIFLLSLEISHQETLTNCSQKSAFTLHISRFTKGQDQATKGLKAKNTEEWEFTKKEADQEEVCESKPEKVLEWMRPWLI
ncbi:hypothetical protein LXL04_012405 [Taraxacum kok-saghyz]